MPLQYCSLADLPTEQRPDQVAATDPLVHARLRSSFLFGDDPRHAHMQMQAQPRQAERAPAPPLPETPPEVEIPREVQVFAQSTSSSSGEKNLTPFFWAFVVLGAFSRVRGIVYRVVYRASFYTVFYTAGWDAL